MAANTCSTRARTLALLNGRKQGFSTYYPNAVLKMLDGRAVRQARGHPGDSRVEERTIHLRCQCRKVDTGTNPQKRIAQLIQFLMMQVCGKQVGFDRTFLDLIGNTPSLLIVYILSYINEMIRFFEVP